MPVVDVHNHFYPPEYLDALRAGGSAIRVTMDADGNPLLHYPGDYNVVVRGHRDIGYRRDVLARERVDLQVLSFTTPGTHVETPERAVRLAYLVNDAFAGVVRERPPRFAALATLPLNDPGASAEELGRAVRELRLPGAMLFSNVTGTPLSDRRFWPLYEVANELGAVLHIHPTNPASIEDMSDYRLMPLLGFLFDTSLAAAGLVFSGVAERYPRIRWVLSHLGGTIPYVAERLDRGYEAFQECRSHTSKPPSAYLREWYYDTVNFDPAALRLAIEFASAEHLLAGSDYPHQIGSIARMRESIEGLDLPAEGKAAILGGTAARLYELERTLA